MTHHKFGYSMNPRANRRMAESAQTSIKEANIEESKKPEIIEEFIINISVFIITRTSGRPNYFEMCMKSIKGQTYKNIINVITVESDKDLEYVNRFSSKGAIICRVEHKIKEEKSTKFDGASFYHAPYNNYINLANSTIQDYCKSKDIKEFIVTHLDDDDCYIDLTAIESITNLFFQDRRYANKSMVQWQVQFPRKVVPQTLELGSRPNLYKTCSNSYAFSGDLLPESKWDEWSCSDFRAARNVFDHASIIKTIPKTLASVQRKDGFGGMGNRDDLKNEPPTKNVVVESPSNDTTSGGINRMIKLAMELPHNNITSGGVKETIKLSTELSNNYDVQIRFQRMTNSAENIPLKWSLGIPDETFPACDICITYSDNPYLDKLVELPQVKKVLIYMLSFGMSMDRELKNVLNPDVIVTCSSEKLETEIKKFNPNVKRIGFGLDMEYMKDLGLFKRQNFLALLYHPADKKRYDLSVEIADILYDKGIINGVLTFGTSLGYSRFKHPKGLVEHRSNASREEVRQIFNRSKCFLFPSISEGLSLSPIESTLCGCPSIICDGAIGEIYIDKENCFITDHDNKKDMITLIENSISNYDEITLTFKKSMESKVNEHKWEYVIENITKLI